MKSFLLTAIGLILLVFAAIGIFLPLWPTTPFVIAAVGFLSSTPRLRAYILKIKFFREHVDNYTNRKGLTKKTMITSLVFLWLMLTLSAVTSNTWYMYLILGLVGIGVTIHIICIAKPKAKVLRGGGNE